MDDQDDALLALLQADEATDSDAIRPRSESGPTVLSFAQQRLWFLQRYAPQSTAYNLTRALRVRGRLDADALERALQAVIARHEILRTVFEERGDAPCQIVLPEVGFTLAREDLSALPSTARGQALDARIQAQADRPFDLAAAPLLRAVLLRLGEQEHVLVLGMHHIVSDAWSNPILARDLGAAYRAALAGERHTGLHPLPVQYADYAIWQRERLQGAAQDADLAYWRHYLGTHLPVLDLPTDWPRPPVQTYRGARVRFPLAQASVSALRRFCRTEHCTAFVVLLAAWQVLLGRYSGQHTFAVGVPNAARNRQELEALIGFFVNTQVYRAHLTPELTARALCRRLRHEARSALDHAELPFEQLLETLPLARDPSRTPVFQVLFNLQTDAGPTTLTLPGLSVEPMAVAETGAKFDLTLDVTVGDEAVRCELEYNADLFEPGTVERMAAHYDHLLAAMLARSDAPIASLPLLSDAEREDVLRAWNRTAVDRVPTEDMLALFERRAREAPERVAAVFERESLTYGELNARANRLARWLRAAGVSTDNLVGVCLAREPQLLVALLAIHKAGGAYLPIDPAHPPARNAHILAHAAPLRVLTQEALRPALAGTVAPVTALETLTDELTQFADDDLGLPTHRQQRAYVLYTSGSTGLPKGVQITLESFANLLHAMQAQLALTPADRLLAVTTLGFDIAGLELFLPLVQGACVVIATREQALQPAALLRRLTTDGITRMQATPATWAMLVEHDDPAWAGLHVLCGGEALNAELARRLLARGVRLTNLYGPTETTIWSAAWPVVDTAAAVIPIGRPIANNRLYVLDGQLEPVPPGVEGELYIGGLGLARGYTGEPRRTAAAFIPNPFPEAGAPGAGPGSRLYRTGDLARYRADGRVEFLGRRDSQVKLRGFRIELGEIEAALAAHPTVCQAVVAVQAGSGGQDLLAAWVVPEGDATPTAPELSAFLAERLPAYMVPAVFTPIPAMPLNANGKIDRGALPAPAWAPSDTHEPPATETEVALAAIWEEVLGIAGAGAQDDIFSLGAQSLQLVRIQSRLQKVFACEIPLARLFQAPTLRAMAACIEQERGDERQDDALAFMNALLETYETGAGVDEVGCR